MSSTPLSQKIEQYLQDLQQFPIENLQDLEQFRLHYLAQKGLIRNLFDEFKKLNSEEKRQLGAKLNELKSQAEQRFQEVQKSLKIQVNTGSKQDLTLPARPIILGSRHPINQVKQQIIRIFARIGFNLEEGAEIESDWYNFSALNMPPEHPARDMQDTFYIAGSQQTFLLRTHTSSTQIRALKRGKLPLRIICPGRVYRNETISSRAHCFFHQIEGLYVDKNVSFSDLKQALYFFVRELFGSQITIRLRPSYFPFTEPSAEMDISCLICAGKGCAVCKHSGWLEILGCGMVNPRVLQNCEISPDEYTGFAFGLGVERITMLIHRITDIRLFSENNQAFLAQFG